MSQGRKTYSILTSAAVFIILEIAALFMLRSSSTLQNIWINRASHRVMTALWGSGEKLHSYFQLEKQNKALVEENAGLYEQIRAYQQKEEAIREAGNGVSDSTKKYRYIPVTIIKMSRNTSHNYIILNTLQL